MTEEEFTQVYLLGYTDRASEKDYDPMKHYNSRTCENCKYLNEFDRCTNYVKQDSRYENGKSLFDKATFYCNKWEAKDD